MSSLRIKIPYQDQMVEADAASQNLLAIIEERPDLAPIDEMEAEAKYALSCPVGSEQVSKYVGADSTVAILVDDYTRPTPAHSGT
jgi:nickel-dependent lactate racemase